MPLLTLPPNVPGPYVISGVRSATLSVSPRLSLSFGIDPAGSVRVPTGSGFCAPISIHRVIVSGIEDLNTALQDTTNTSCTVSVLNWATQATLLAATGMTYDTPGQWHYDAPASAFPDGTAVQVVVDIYDQSGTTLRRTVTQDLMPLGAATCAYAPSSYNRILISAVGDLGTAQDTSTTTATVTITDGAGVVIVSAAAMSYIAQSTWQYDAAAADWPASGDLTIAVNVLNAGGSTQRYRLNVIASPAPMPTLATATGLSAASSTPVSLTAPVLTPNVYVNASGGVSSGAVSDQLGGATGFAGKLFDTGGMVYTVAGSSTASQISTLIQTVLNAGGGTVEFPPGAGNPSSAIVIPSGYSGVGLIIRAQGRHGTVLNCAQGGIDGTGFKGWLAIEHLILDGGSHAGPYKGIYGNFSGSVLRDLIVQHFTGDGVVLDSTSAQAATYNRLDNVWALNNGGNGVTISNTSGNPASHNLITGGQANGNTGHGIAITDATSTENIIEGAAPESNGNAGLYLAGSAVFHPTGCEMNGTVSTGSVANGKYAGLDIYLDTTAFQFDIQVPTVKRSRVLDLSTAKQGSRIWTADDAETWRLSSLVPGMQVWLPAWSIAGVAANAPVTRWPGLGRSGYQLLPVNLASAVTISAISAANPTQLTSTAAHGLTTGNTVHVTNSTSTPQIDGYYVVTVVDSTHFTIPVAVTGAGTSATVQQVSAQPALKTSVLNAKSTALFTAASLHALAFPAGSLSLLSNLSALTLCAVVRPTTATAQQVLASWTTTGSGSQWLTVQINSSGLFQVVARRTNTDGLATVPGVAALTAGTFYLLSAVIDFVGGNVTTYINGVQDSTIALAGTPGRSATQSSVQAFLGALAAGGPTAYLNADLAELVIATGPASTSVRQTIEQALAASYGLAV